MANVGGGLKAEVPEGLRELVTPVAFFPDALLAHVLAASTYPAEVIAANRRTGAGGGENNLPVENQKWSPEVKSLAQAPLMLDWMEKQPAWMVGLGNAFLKNPADVLLAIQAVRSEALSGGALAPTADFLVEVEGTFLLIRPAIPGVVQVPAPESNDRAADSAGTQIGSIPRSLIFLEIDWLESQLRVRKPENLHPWIASHPMWADEALQLWEHSIPHRLGVLYPMPSDSLDDFALSFEVNWNPGYEEWYGDFPGTLTMPLMRSRIPDPEPEDFEMNNLLPEALPPRPLPSINRKVHWSGISPKYVRLISGGATGPAVNSSPAKNALTPQGNLAFCSVASTLGRRLMSSD